MLFRLTLSWFALVALLQSAFIYAFMLNDTLQGSDFAIGQSSRLFLLKLSIAERSLWLTLKDRKSNALKFA